MTAMNTYRFLRALLSAFAASTALGAERYPSPGQAMKTPVLQKTLDPAAYLECQNGEERSPEGRGGDRGPGWVLWTADGRGVGHSGVAFGIRKEAGPRHLRVGLSEPVLVGTILTRGNVQVSVLREMAAYPGRLERDAEWLPGQRLAAGEVTTDQMGSGDDLALWVFPSETRTRALRFTHVAAPADPKYEGWLGGAAILAERYLDVAPFSMVVSGSNSRHARKVTNGKEDGWGCWENTGMGETELANRAEISPEHAEWLQLIWQEPVTLAGLTTIWTGFGATEIQAYAGPASLHPRSAQEKDWRTVSSPTGFESGYPSRFWPNWFPFPEQVTTRSVRLRITGATPVPHPHVRNKTADGKRVWLGEVMAIAKLGDGPLEDPGLQVTARQVHPPIGIPFTMPEEGYVTLVLEDSTGRRVRNLVSETWFPAGENTAWWDGTDDLGRDLDAANHGLYSIPGKFVVPGQYVARGLWRKEIEPFFEFVVYGEGNPPWNVPDHTGAWLANHSPPSAAAFVPATHSPTREPAVFLGCYVTEGPDGMAWVDLNGRKRGGMKWIGGNWTGAPFLAYDPAPGAKGEASAYAASVWETGKKSGVYELRVSALDRQDGNRLTARAVYREEIGLQKPGEEQGLPNHGREHTRLGGIACYNGRVACTFPEMGRVIFISAATGEVVEDVPVAEPRGLAYDADGRLFLLSGSKLLRVEPSDKPFDQSPRSILVSQGLDDPVAVALDGKGNLYVSDRGSSHQVKVFSPTGQFLRAIGHPGKPKAGPYDKLHMNNPAGLAVDSQNQLWVTEDDFLPKRVSVWSLDGKLIRAFYGPGKYGGGGALDSHQSDRFYYADEQKGTLEFSLDWQQGKAELISVLYRKTPESMEQPFRSAAPETALYRGRQRYFTNCYNTNPTQGHNTAFLYIEREGIARPVVAMGMANEWPLLNTPPFRGLWPQGTDPEANKWANGMVNQALFIWTDRNGDEHAQPDEVKLHHTPVRGMTVMPDLSFCIANAGGRALRLAPTGFSPDQVPSYDYAQALVIATGVKAPTTTGGDQMLADDSDETVITLGIEPFHSHSVCGAKAGKASWSYPSPWPGLHASHHAAKPDRPGQLIGTTRLLGGFVTPRGSQVEPLWAVNGNMGNLYLLTRDGLFVSTVFRDVRQAKLWKMAVAERGMSLKGLSLHDENFWPSISQTPEGQVYLVDGANCSLVRLDGLETLRRIEPRDVKVTPESLQASRQYVLEQEALRQQAMGNGILRAAIRKDAPQVDGSLDDWREANWVEIDKRGDGANFNSNAKPYRVQGAIAVSGDRLYAAWDCLDGNLLRNSGELPQALFKTGGALDLMLGCDPAAAADRRQPVAGDLRLLVTRVDKRTRAILYRQVAVQADPAQRVPFSSPWRTVMFDQVLDVSDQVVLAANGKGVYEISIPLQVLGLAPKPGMRIKGDIGVLRGNGTETTARSYWSNKATAITADVPSEVMLAPRLWGTIEYQ